MLARVMGESPESTLILKVSFSHVAEKGNGLGGRAATSPSREIKGGWKSQNLERNPECTENLHLLFCTAGVRRRIGPMAELGKKKGYCTSQASGFQL